MASKNYGKVSHEMSWFGLIISCACELCSAYLCSVGKMFWLIPIVVVEIGLLWSLQVLHKPNLRIISSFVKNTVGGDFLSIMMLIWFLMNFSWFVDATFELVVKFDWSCSSFAYSLIALSGLLILVCMYPDYEDADLDMSERKIVFTGISYDNSVKRITSRNIDSLFCPLVCDVVEGEGNNNTSMKLDGICKYVIIPSKELLTKPFDNSFIESIDSNELKSRFIEYNAHILSSETRTGDMAELLKDYCRNMFDKDIDFVIESSVDYNVFSDVFDTFEKVLSKFRTGESILYISLGTSILSGALSMLAVKGKRIILYLSQADKQLKTFYPSKRNLYSWYISLDNDD